MADEAFTTKKLLGLRKLTRAVGDLVRGQLKDYLSALAIQFRPKSVYGEFVEGPKEYIKGAEANFKELQAAYESLCGAKPFNLPKEFKQPLAVASQIPEVNPLEYVHEAKAEGQTKIVTVTAPLKFVLTYTGFAPKRLKELLAARVSGGPSTDLQEFILHALMIQGVVSRQAGMGKILEALRFPLAVGKIPGAGDLPFVFATAAVPTVLPPDNVIIESTEISGTDTFEEVVNLEALTALKDPFKDKLIELAQQHGEKITPLA
jgi:hypothetical protein